MLTARTSSAVPARAVVTESPEAIRAYGSRASDRNSADISADGRQVVIGLADGRLEHWQRESMD